jgi:hypothetical protein
MQVSVVVLFIPGLIILPPPIAVFVVGLLFFSGVVSVRYLFPSSK